MITIKHFVTKLIFLLTISISLFFSNCKKSSTEDVTETSGNTIKGEITTDKTIKASDNALFDGTVIVTNNATLTIEAGATIKFTKGISLLVISRGAKIIAEGTADKPIVFTSNEVTPKSGDWAGIVLLGKATTNATDNGVAAVGKLEGGLSLGDNGLYGGTNDNDNSGILKYVRIEYAGYAASADNELNSLTLGAVGNGTTIDYIQVIYALDDAFEWFGGTVNCKHLVTYKTLDDDFDSDNGYRGNIQFALAIRDKDIADKSGSNGIESDNDAQGSALTPNTAPVFSNLTIVGPRALTTTVINTQHKNGAQIRRNSSLSIFNSIIVGYPTGILLDGAAVNTNATSGKLEIQNTILARNTVPVNGAGTNGFNATDATAWFIDASRNNTDNADNLPAPLDKIFETYTPTAEITGAAFTNAKVTNTFFTQVTYKGAIKDASDKWWTGWTSFK